MIIVCYKLTCLRSIVLDLCCISSMFSGRSISLHAIITVSEDILKATEIKTANTGDEEQHKYLNVLNYIIFNTSLQDSGAVRDAISTLLSSVAPASPPLRELQYCQLQWPQCTTSCRGCSTTSTGESSSF